MAKKKPLINRLDNKKEISDEQDCYMNEIMKETVEKEQELIELKNENDKLKMQIANLEVHYKDSEDAMKKAFETELEKFAKQITELEDQLCNMAKATNQHC